MIILLRVLDVRPQATRFRCQSFLLPVTRAIEVILKVCKIGCTTNFLSSVCEETLTITFPISIAFGERFSQWMVIETVLTIAKLMGVGPVIDGQTQV